MLNVSKKGRKQKQFSWLGGFFSDFVVLVVVVVVVVEVRPNSIRIEIYIFINI